jgi:putative Mn2+ efflux pump MntP
MSLTELFLLAVGLSMDAFAVSVCSGLTMRESVLKKALITGVYFGVFQAAMPLAGYAAATFFADMITAYDHWIAFTLLCAIGGKMIIETVKDARASESHNERPGADSGPPRSENAEVSVKPARMLPLALATSIDALAVGISFAFLRVNIAPAVSFIGAVTFIISFAGVKIGNVFGSKFKSGAELAGGAILVLLGFKILFEHLAF